VKFKIQNSKLKTQNLTDPFLWLTLLLCLPVIGPLLQPGYFWGAHDARHSVYFLFEFNNAIQDGIWYPRWSPNQSFGFGYPFFNIYGPLSSYAGQFLLWAGLDIVTAVKTVFGLSAILSGLTMYLFVRRMLGQPAGLIAALIYVYIPYHIFDLYVRAALAESVGFVFVPLVLWGFYESVAQPRLRAILWGALAYAALMFTSNLLALMFTPILGLYVACMLLANGRITEWTKDEGRGTNEPNIVVTQYAIRNTQYAIRLIRAGFPSLFVFLLGLGLGAIFWLPAFVEYPYVRVDQWVGGRFAFGDDFVEIFQLFSPRWGFGASIPGPDDDAGFQIGLAAMVLFVLSFLIVPKLADTPTRRTLYFFQAMTVVLIFLTTPASYFVWAVLPLSTFAQFPWRLLVVIAPFISICAGTIVASSQMSDVSSQMSVVSSQMSVVSSQKSDTDNLQSPISNLQSSKSLETQNSKLKTQNLSLIILVALILLSSYPYLQAEVRDPKPTEGPVSQAALFRFQQSADEMTGQTAWARRIPNWSTLAEQVERGGQITTKVNYTALPADNSVGVYSMEMDSVHELLWVGTDKEGQSVAFFVPYYPGWKATIYEDLGPHDGNLDEEKGPVTRIGPAVDEPEISVTPSEGWMVVPIPPGSHFLELRFEDTPVRIVGFWVTIISVVVWVGLFAGKAGSPKQSQESKTIVLDS
jgi:hypothetical protein